MYTDVYRYIYRAFPVDSVVKNCLQCRSLRFDVKQVAEFYKMYFAYFMSPLEGKR